MPPIEKLLGTHNCGEFRFQNLKSHFPMVPQIFRQIHRSHPALSQIHHSKP